MEGSAQGILEKSIAAPNPQSLISSGRALERPPAPTSCIKLMGLASPSCQH